LSWHHYVLFLSSLVNFGVFCILSHWIIRVSLTKGPHFHT
jgi:hypothetical protein